MESDIQSLTTRKIEEFLVQMGISNPKDTPIAPHIASIANFVHETRLKAELKGVPDCLIRGNIGYVRECANGERGSYRLLSNNLKRQQLSYKGLDRPAGKRRPKGTERNRPEAFCQNSSENGTTDNRNSTTDCESTRLHQRRTEPTTLADRQCESGHEVYPLRNTNESKSCRNLASYQAETNMTSPTVITTTRATIPENNSVPPSANGSTSDIKPDPEVVGETISSNCAYPLFCSSVMNDTLGECARLIYAIGRYTQGRPDRVDKNFRSTANIQEISGNTQRLADLNYSEAMYCIQKTNSILSSHDIQGRHNESAFWEIIKKGEALLDPTTFSSQKGPLDEFTMTEKAATRKFMSEVGIGLSPANQRRRRRLWKRLYELRKAGVVKTLLYRTGSLNDFCVNFSDNAEVPLVDTILSWEKLYGPEIAQLETRVMKVGEGDESGRSYLTQPRAAERLSISDPETTWNSARNEWLSDLEEIEFCHTAQSLSASEDEMGSILDIRDDTKNKSIFISLTPKDGKFLSVVPIVQVKKDDTLGVFAGHLRYSDDVKVKHGIHGPRKGLWLDYSQVTGALNLMRVSRPGEFANVRLVWELYDVGELKPAWRVSVRATTEIKAFDEIVRSAEHEAQFLMHQDSACARQGFLE